MGQFCSTQPCYQVSLACFARIANSTAQCMQPLTATVPTLVYSLTHDSSVICSNAHACPPSPYAFNQCFAAAFKFPAATSCRDDAACTSLLLQCHLMISCGRFLGLCLALERWCQILCGCHTSFSYLVQTWVSICHYDVPLSTFFSTCAYKRAPVYLTTVPNLNMFD